jgi:prepilin-type N-terminal cleavage/methylation domain-containing protein
MEGFTLIELSIVLVIIGLLVGGILVGKDLIRAAELRATISQVEKLKTAVNTFKTKYNALPGDIISSQAAAFGFAARTGGTGDGDGDGWIESCGLSYVFFGAGNATLGCETVFFWTDLSAAKLVQGSFTTTTDALITNLASSVQVAPYLPPIKAGNGWLFVWAVDDGWGQGPHNYIQIMAISGTTVNGAIVSTDNPNVFPLSPADAWNIDTKIDDGMPGTGQVLGTEGPFGSPDPYVAPSINVGIGSQPGGYDCWSWAVFPYPYALTSTNPPTNYPSSTCGLQFNGQF